MSPHLLPFTVYIDFKLPWSQRLTLSENANLWLCYLGLGVARAVGQSDSSGSVLVSGIGMRERGNRSWFQSSCGNVSTRQGRAKSVSRE